MTKLEIVKSDISDLEEYINYLEARSNLLGEIIATLNIPQNQENFGLPKFKEFVIMWTKKKDDIDKAYPNC